MSTQTLERTLPHNIAAEKSVLGAILVNNENYYRVIESILPEDFYLGAHAPDLTEEEINLIHELWRGVTRESGMGDIRHKEIVVVALQRLAEDLAGKARKEILARLRSLDHSIRETEDEENKR